MGRPGSKALYKAADLGKEPDKIPLAIRIKCNQEIMEGKTTGSEPQVGPDNVGESHSSQEDCPKDSGEGNQPFTGISEEDFSGFEIAEPFARRDSILRTPPRRVPKYTGEKTPLCTPEVLCRTDITHEESNAEKATKRKRLNDSPQEIVKQDKGKLSDYQASLAKLYKQIGYLEKVVGDMYKPKRELAETAERLVLYAKSLQILKIESLLEDNGENPKTAGEQDEIQSLRGQLLSMEDKYRNDMQKMTQELKKYKQEIQDMKNIDKDLSGISCEECKKTIERKQKRRQIKLEETLNNFQSITEEEWESDLFQKIPEEPNPIGEAPPGWDIVLPCSKEVSSNDRATRRAIENFGGKEGLKKQNRGNGELVLMTHTVGFPDEDENMVFINKWIYYPIISEKISDEVVEERHIFDSFKTIKRHITENNRKNLAVPVIEGVVGTAITRIVTYLFSDTHIEIKLFKDHKVQPRNYARQVSQAKSKTDDSSDAKRPRRPKGDALLIKMDNMKYADLFKTVRSSINPSEIGVDIQQIRETRKGELLVSVRNGSDKAEVLRKEISQKFPKASVLMRKERKVLHIKNLDSLTTEEDVREALVKTTNLKEKDIDVRALRPAFGNKQNVTVVMEVEAADKLLQSGSIKIGWMRCRILERKEVMKCYRCWDYGHKKSQCTGPNRENNCLKCGNEGHKAKDCQNKECCVNCGKEGHQTGSFKCPQNVI